MSLNSHAQLINADSNSPNPIIENYTLQSDTSFSDELLTNSEIQRNSNQKNLILKKGLKNNTFLFIGFLIFFLIIIYIKLASPDYLNTIYQYVSSGKFFLNEIDKSKTGYSLNNTLLDILFVLVLSIFFYELLWDTFQFFYIEILIGISIFYLAQVIISFVFYYIFFGADHRNIHLLNIILFNRTLAIVITPIIFISTYLYDPYKQIIANIILIFITGVYIYRIIRVLSQLKKLYSFNYLYIFLYLCVFEISLYFIFIKQIGWFFN